MINDNWQKYAITEIRNCWKEKLSRNKNYEHNASRRKTKKTRKTPTCFDIRYFYRASQLVLGQLQRRSVSVPDTLSVIKSELVWHKQQQVARNQS